MGDDAEPIDLDDSALWERAVEGDGVAFGELWSRHHPSVFRRLVRLDGGTRDAEDLTAVVFLELWRHRRRVELRNGSLVPWLLRTTENVARNHARAARRYRAFLGRLPPVEPAADPAEIVDARRTAEIESARRGIEALPEADRDLLRMTAIEGRPMREVASVLDITENAANVRLSRIRGRLRRAAEGSRVDGGEA